MHLFEESWKRIDRSRMHAVAFMDEFHRLFPNDDRYKTCVEQEAQGIWIVKAVFGENLENDLALQLGEFFYQLRSALDAAVWQAVSISEGSEPNDSMRYVSRLEFPIGTESNFRKAAIHKFKFPDKLRNWIGTIQTDSAEKSMPDPDSGLNVTLETLNNCARKDRHRKLQVMAAVAEAIEYNFLEIPHDLSVNSVEPIDADFLKGKNAFLRLRIAGPPVDPSNCKIKLETNLLIDVSVKEIPKFLIDGVKGGFAGELKRFGLAVEYIINQFESAFL